MASRVSNWLQAVLTFKVLRPALHFRKCVLAKRHSKGRIMVNFGSGYFFEPAWKSMDFGSPEYPYFSKSLDYNFDLTGNEPWPFEDDSVDLIYSSHTLEHIPQIYCQKIFAEIYRCLKPGGGVRLTMPDLDIYFEAYLKQEESIFSESSSRFQSLEQRLISVFAWGAAEKVDPDDVKRRAVEMPRAAFADYFLSLLDKEDLNKPSQHKNWWNMDKLSTMLQEAGFKNVNCSAPQKSTFLAMRSGNGLVEKLVSLFPKNRMLGFDNAHPKTSIYVEAIK